MIIFMIMFMMINVRLINIGFDFML